MSGEIETPRLNWCSIFFKSNFGQNYNNFFKPINEKKVFLRFGEISNTFPFINIFQQYCDKKILGDTIHPQPQYSSRFSFLF